MNLREYISQGKIIMLDGGMGTELEKRGAALGKNSIKQNPEIVMQIHKDYIDAGSNIITANSFTLNSIYDKSHGGDGNITEDILTAVRLAKKAAGDDVYILGDMCSTGEMLEPYGDLTEEECEENYYEAAVTFLNAGVDGIIIETFFDLNEMLCAVRGCRKASSEIPIFASMTYSTVENGGRTIMGNSAEQIALELVGAGVDVIGVNCGDLSPTQCGKICEIYSNAVNVPILVQPNAGLPEIVDGKTVFNMQPSEFADMTSKCLESGAMIFGGCCGTTPSHISELAKILK